MKHQKLQDRILEAVDLRLAGEPLGDDVLDRTLGTVIDTVTVGSVPRTPIAANDLIWVPSYADDTVSVIDPTGTDNA